MYQNKVLRNVSDFLEALPDRDQGKIRLAMDAMAHGYFNSAYVKLIHSPIKELIVKDSRILFFIKDGNIYFVNAFIKKTMKTPKPEIEKALRIYKFLR